MNLLNNDLKSILNPEQLSEESLNDAYIESLLELDDALEDIKVQEAVENDLNTLCEIKNHIDKYGVSEETLSLFGDDLAKLGIVEDTSKEVALETIEDIVTQNSDTEGSEEVLITAGIAAWALVNSGLVVAAASGIAGVLGGLGVAIAAFVVFSKNSLKTLKALSGRISSNGFKDFGKKTTKLRILHKDKFLTQVNGCESILKFVSSLSPTDAVKTEFSQKASLLTPLGYNLDDGKISKAKESIDKITLSNSGYTEESIKTLINKGMVLCDIARKFDNFMTELKAVSKKKVNTEGEKISDEDKSQMKFRVKEYREFMNVSIKSNKEVISKIVSLGKATIK